MVGKKEIRTQISSVQNTQIVTKAMNMVAISKMRKSEARMAASRPYAQTIQKVIGHVALGNLEYQHPYLEVRAVNKVGYLVVSTDRGLCGGLNAELFKAALADMQTWIEQGVAVELALVGTKAISFFSPMKQLSILTQVSGLGDKPALSDLIGLVKLLRQAYQQGALDRLYLICNKFVNTMVQRVQIDQLLPVLKSETPEIKGNNWDYLYEPNAKILLDTLLSRFIESQIYQGVVENLACEQAARMVAMQSATDNAGSLLKELQLTYNKARQAGITQELSEIVAGAAAV